MRPVKISSYEKNGYQINIFVHSRIHLVCNSFSRAEELITCFHHSSCLYQRLAICVNINKIGILNHLIPFFSEISDKKY